MGIIRIPRIKLVRNPLRTHDPVKILVLSQALVVPAGAQHVGVPPVTLEEPGVGQVGQVVSGQIEVAILVVVALQKLLEIEGPGHGQKPGKQVRTAQCDVDRMVAAEAAPQRHQVRIAVLEPHQRYHFADHVILKLHVPCDAPARRDGPVVPALHVH